ncbi:MAG TPA: hypothetical protein VFG30_38610 [Polyangiales bacterium]|jgi:hypothetical protein|nr:hypothetical protein [Polyangiales bacterium]
MHISLVNFTKIADYDVLKVVRAINRQLREDFTPQWHWGAEVRMEGCSPLNDNKAQNINALKQAPQDLRGDAILYLWDKLADAEGALGYHDQNNRGLPYGFVFTELSKQLGEAWSVTLSHEVLELIGDANVNTFAAGPHPAEPDRVVFHWYEMCDAVQAESYEIDGVEVSNFVLPLYFTVGEQTGARNDYLNRVKNGKGLKSFGVNPGGYLGFFDPQKGDHDTYAPDSRAKQRLKIKAGLGRARRAPLYRELQIATGKSPRLEQRRPVQRVAAGGRRAKAS